MTRRSKTLRSALALQRANLIEDSEVAPLNAVAKRYAVALTEDVIETINVNDPNDPIARQYLPSVAELQQSNNELVDPIGDEVHSPLPGLVHRYPDRVLLKPTLVCPVYCRFCFRREQVGHNASAPLSDAQLDQIFDYVAARPEIWEVIVSGGDPLALSSRRLAALIDRLKQIDHVRVLRFHSRVPVAAPSLINAELVAALASAKQATYVLVHANHANELNAAAKAACERLRRSGITLLSQTVLLRQVNDSVAALSALMRAFVEAHIVPYYLHHPDLAPGSAHFRVSIERGQRLLKALRGQYSGLCQPEYVIDIPGGDGKSPLTPSYLNQCASNPSHYLIEDYQGEKHAYIDHADGQQQDAGSDPASS
ncbi:MAG: lysine-2,3-aminomutase-like protein [Pseudomonadales bacterium]